MEQNKFNFSGVIPSPVDERDYTYGMVAQADPIQVALPSSFQLTYQFPVKNQGQVGSCVAHSISEMDEIIRAMNKQLSPGYVYANRTDSQWQGSGMMPREALRQLVNCGIPLNELFPINEEYPGIKATLAKYDTTKITADSITRKSESFISLNKDEVKKYIFNEKKPVLVTVSVYESFYNTVNGVVPNASGKALGGHAMLIIGWKDDMFVVLNHWGEWGGAKGYLYIPLSFNSFKEFWSVTEKPIIKPIVPTPTPGPIIKPQNATLYKVQVGAFKQLKNAQALRSEIAAKGLTSCISLYPTCYKVQLGAFKEKTNADALLKKAQYLGYKDAFIVTVI